MSIFSELLPKLNEISNAIAININDDLKKAFDCFEKFEEEYINSRSKAREKTLKDKNAKTALQIINEDEVEPSKNETESKRSSSNKSPSTASHSSNDDMEKRASKKRSKKEVDGISSPEQDKRLKRNASVKAQSIISQQVNVNLTQKLRRERSTDKEDKNQSARSKRQNNEKENAEPNTVPAIQIKLEKVSIAAEPEQMETESLPVNIELKQEGNTDDIAMPPPAVPIPRPRKAVPKAKSEEASEEEPSSRRRTTRTRKQTDSAPPPVPRSSSRARVLEPETTAAPEARPKRTRGRKKLSANDTEKEMSSQESLPASPAEKPRPKRTRRGQRAAEKEQPKPIKPEPVPIQTFNEESLPQPESSSPILPQKGIKAKNKKEITTLELDMTDKEKETTLTNKDSTKTDKVDKIDKDAPKVKGGKELGKAKGGKALAVAKEKEEMKSVDNDVVDNIAFDETKVLVKAGELDQTVVLPNGVFNHVPITPKSIFQRAMNETVVLGVCNRDTMILDKGHDIMDGTVVIDKGIKTAPQLTEDNSLMTDDSDAIEADEQTPPKKGIPPALPSSAVKEKVQQFEELASRVTRTKTRAMAKKAEETEAQTPPDNVTKPVLSSETLAKMNGLIFNGRSIQMSSSACKPRAIVPPAKTQISYSTSKLSAINKFKEAAEESLKEDARKKKEAMLEAKRELQKRKREDKMAAAAAARSLAERSRRAAIIAAAKEREEKQAHADLGRVERMREAERKKQELARKVAETEERRKAEEMARQQRLEEEQKRATEQRKKQIEEQEAMKREAAKMAREIEQKQREYIEKQKKQRHDDRSYTPLKLPSTPAPRMRPVHMEDGFQYLNSDEEAEPVDRPVPIWSTSKARRAALLVQSATSSAHTDRLFSVRVHSPDLRELFPNIERARLKRTSSAVWRTPPHRE